jgi:hypothetical protein
MNYIHKLESDVEDLKNQVEAHKEVDRELRSYLALDKFKNDTTVQTSDIYHHLNEYHFYYHLRVDISNAEQRVKRNAINEVPIVKLRGFNERENSDLPSKTEWLKQYEDRE